MPHETLRLISSIFSDAEGLIRAFTTHKTLALAANKMHRINATKVLKVASPVSFYYPNKMLLPQKNGENDEWKLMESIKR